MMNKFLLITLSATGAFAAVSNVFLAERAIVQVPCSDQGEKDCGSGCIPLSWTCCPDGSGGCPSSAFCSLGTNGEYGCCPNGEVCGGEGGASTDAETNTIIVPETSTIFGESTTTEAGESSQPPTETETVPVETTTSIPVEETTSSFVVEPPTTSQSATFQTQPQTTPVTTPGNSTKPVSTSAPSSVPVNGATSYGINILGGFMAGLAALMI